MTKVGHLKNGGGLNGAVVLNGTTLAADGQADQLNPNPSSVASDLFVLDLQDQFQFGTSLPSTIETQQRIVV